MVFVSPKSAVTRATAPEHVMRPPPVEAAAAPKDISNDDGISMTKVMATSLGLATAVTQTHTTMQEVSPQLKGRLAEATLRATTPTLRVQDILTSIKRLQTSPQADQFAKLLTTIDVATRSVSFQALTPAAQLEQLNRLLADKQNLPHWVYGDGLLPQLVAAVSADRCSMWNAAVVAIQTGTLASDAVCVREVAVAGHRVRIHSPHQWPEQAPPMRDVVDAVSRLPVGVSRLINRIVMRPKPEASIVATANRSTMNITIHRSSLPHPTASREARVIALGNDLAHEAGHLVHGHMDSRHPALSKAFESAAQTEPRITGYAHENLSEDFAETLAVYVTTKGTPLHDAMRGLTPKRFAILDEVMVVLDRG
jgi:hypothetical protein